jgi:uncharacterized protein
MDSELVLIGLFRHLVERGFPLGVRDFRDALFALRSGAGTLQRERLLWLCRTLWARSDEEATWLERLFHEFPRPSDSELAPWLPAEPILSGSAAASQADPSIASTVAGSHEVPELRFQAAGQGGTVLPRAILPPGPEEPFVYAPRPLLSLRSLVICWRRFRTAQRLGPKVDLDVTATIQEKCRTGIVRSPVFSASRQNQARVLVLADASASMSPFAAFFRVLDESLTESRLRWSRLLYFENVPSDVLYETESFLRPVELKNLLRDHPGTPLMILSDAGAARQSRNRKRVEGTRRFLSGIAPAWRPVVWVNPMPRARWAGTSAEQIARFSYLSMLELNEDGMLAAIDALRGLKDAA